MVESFFRGSDSDGEQTILLPNPTHESTQPVPAPDTDVSDQPTRREPIVNPIHLPAMPQQPRIPERSNSEQTYPINPPSIVPPQPGRRQNLFDPPPQGPHFPEHTKRR